MYYCTITGDHGQILNWKKEVKAYSSWLNYSVQFEFHEMTYSTLGIAFIGSWHDAMITIEEDLWEVNLSFHNRVVTKDIDYDSLTIQVLKQTNYLQVTMPLATPEHCYYYTATNVVMVSNDQRLLARFSNNELNESSIYFLLENGIQPPDQSIYIHVKRLPANHVLTSTPEGTQCEMNELFHMGIPKGSKTSVLNRVDDMVNRVPEGSVLLFSGGVDSAIIAARLKEFGKQDILLQNYSFGTDDPEGKFAKEVADHIGLPFRQIFYNDQAILRFSEKIGKEYSFPFVDQAVIPTNMMVQDTLSQISIGGAVIEGSGADVIFASQHELNRWERVYQMSRFFRKMLSPGYDMFKIYNADKAYGTLFRVMKKSTTAPIEYAMAMMKNCLEGTVFDSPSEIRNRNIQSLYETTHPLCENLSLHERISLIRIILKAAGISAAKSFDPLHSNGVQSMFPFLDKDLILMSTTLEMEQKSVKGIQKVLLKEILANHIPHNYVYRPKSGFLPPFKEILKNKDVIELIHDYVLNPSNKCLAYVDKKLLIDLLEKGAKGEELSFDIHNFLWGFIFLSLWIFQVEEGLQSSAEDTLNLVK